MNDLTDAIAADSCGGPRRLTTSRLFAGIGILCFLLAAASPPASAQYDDLLKRLPRGANSVVVIDAKALLGTELAVREGWAQKRELKFRDRPISIPPEEEVVAIGAQLDPSEGLRRQWELAVMRLSEPFPMQDIARSEGGYIDTFGTTQAAWTPSNAYFVDLDKNTLGIMYPADRQYVARWAKFAATNKAVELSDYLQAAAKQLGPKTQIVMALDLADVVQPHRVQEALEESAEVKDLPGKPEQYTPLIASIRGVTLTIGVSNRITGSVRVDFDQPVAPLGKHAKPLFLEALDRFQARIPDLDRWTVSLQEKSIVLEGTLTTEGARRIGSLVEIPTTKFSDLKGVEPAKPDSVDYVKTSQGYYRSVTTLINDLRKTMEENRHRDYTPCGWSATAAKSMRCRSSTLTRSSSPGGPTSPRRSAARPSCRSRRVSDRGSASRKSTATTSTPAPMRTATTTTATVPSRPSRPRSTGRSRPRPAPCGSRTSSRSRTPPPMSAAR
jgi:hypothetical protein